DTAAGGGVVRCDASRADNKGRAVKLHQEGTYAPDCFRRWMATPAIDRQGNIAIGYSFGGSANFPGQRFAARLADDPLGVLTFHETVLADGEASQNVMRWAADTQAVIGPSE